MEITPSAYPAIGAVTAAVIAGAISFVSTVLSKDQKTSEFRQAWIDSLREELSEFLSHIVTIASFLRIKRARGGTIEQLMDYLEEKDDEVRQAEMMYTRIRLRLNPKEHEVLLEKLRDVHSLLASPQIFERDHVNQLSDALTRESQRVLKSEWKRVKRGEFAFVATKYVSLAILLTAIGLAFLYAEGYVAIKVAP
jgi:hypothetical protein